MTEADRPELTDGQVRVRNMFMSVVGGPPDTVLGTRWATDSVGMSGMSGRGGAGGEFAFDQGD